MDVKCSASFLCYIWELQKAPLYSTADYHTKPFFVILYQLNEQMNHKSSFFLQKVEVGLQLQALKLLCEATRKADEELQSYSQDFVETSSVIETYMTIANFCDKRLREEEQSDAGE